MKRKGFLDGLPVGPLTKAYLDVFRYIEVSQVMLDPEIIVSDPDQIRQKLGTGEWGVAEMVSNTQRGALAHNQFGLSSLIVIPSKDRSVKAILMCGKNEGAILTWWSFCFPKDGRRICSVMLVTEQHQTTIGMVKGCRSYTHLTGLTEDNIKPLLGLLAWVKEELIPADGFERVILQYLRLIKAQEELGREVTKNDFPTANRPGLVSEHDQALAALMR